MNLYNKQHIDFNTPNPYQTQLDGLSLVNNIYYIDKLIQSNKVLEFNYGVLQQNYNKLNENNKALLSEIDILKSKLDEMHESELKQNNEISLLEQLLKAKNSLISFLQKKLA